ncbi:MAG: sulfite exporter TauE/SafE family protein [Parcubacteria group bacterium SW_4_49_11]|nr:MAG: sulfite exporter TauE/SafE family protein [Parcubacteria group bacterium SW_4_49_11]
MHHFAKSGEVRKRIGIAGLTLIAISLIVLVNGGSVGYWTAFWWMLPVAFGLSLVTNTVGISGAALLVPFLILIFPFFADPVTNLESVKVGLITESFGLLSSAVAFLVFGLVDIKIALRTVLIALPFLVAGTVLTAFIPETILLFMIAGVLFVAVFFFLFEERFRAHRREEQAAGHVDWSHAEDTNGTLVEKHTRDGRAYHYCRSRSGYLKRFGGYSVGAFFQGAVGFGIGELGIIAMIASHIPIRIAIGTSHLVVAMTAIIASGLHLTFASQGHSSSNIVPWNMVVMTIPAVILAGQISPFVASQLSTKILERLIAGLFVLIAGALVVLAVTGE